MQSLAVVQACSTAGTRDVQRALRAHELLCLRIMLSSTQEDPPPPLLCIQTDYTHLMPPSNPMAGNSLVWVLHEVDHLRDDVLILVLGLKNARCLCCNCLCYRLKDSVAYFPCAVSPKPSHLLQYILRAHRVEHAEQQLARILAHLLPRVPQSLNLHVCQNPIEVSAICGGPTKGAVNEGPGTCLHVNTYSQAGSASAHIL